MNTSALRVWYETGVVEEVHLPDPAFENGISIQREIIDFHDPDSGIFVERHCIDDNVEDPDRNPDEAPVLKKEADKGPYRILKDRTMVLTPERLSYALLIECHGVEVLRRDPCADTRCGLAVTAPAEIGYDRAGVERNLEWLAGGLEAVISRLFEFGDDGLETIERVYANVVSAQQERSE